MLVKSLPCLRVYCPEWFEREDFKKCLNDHILGGAKNDNGSANPNWRDRPIASWHTGGEPCPEGSDVFVMVDGDDLSEDGILPQDIADEIKELCAKHNVDHGIVWLTYSEQGD